MKSQYIRVFALLLLAVLLLGCAGSESFSAEDAAVKFGIETMNQGAVVDQGSIVIRQVHETDENKKYVFFSFDRQAGNRLEHCMMLYETHRGPLGLWSSGSGGGGCGGQVGGAEEAMPAIDSGAGSSTSSDNPQGVSQAYGLVYDENIIKIRVTWDDRAAFESELINSSYLVMRDGQFNTSLIEGLDADGAVVERVEWGRAPGKE